MATITVDDTHVYITLNRFERFFGILPSLTIHVEHIRQVSQDDGILRNIGMRAPGLAWPGKALIGTFRKWKFKDFVVWRSEPHFVVLRLESEKWDRVVVGVRDPDSIVLAITAVVG
jgi:hypothetical protein